MPETIGIHSACEKLTSHTPLTEWGLLIWDGSFPFQGMEWSWRTANTPEMIPDGLAYEKLCLVKEQ